MLNVDLTPETLPAHLQNLNPEQLEAARHFEGPILVLAGAGSGKTRILTRRVASLILDHNVSPRNILAITFTNKATEEMRERLRNSLGEAGYHLWVSTFHSAGLRILRHNAKLLGYSNDFVVYDDQDSKGVLKAVMKDQGIDDKKFPVDIFSRAIDHAKNSYLSPSELGKEALGYEGKLSAEVYDHYQRALLKANAMDFGDLLYNSVKLLKQHPQALEYYRNLFHFILVDEFQDTNKVQYMFIRLLAEPRRNLLVVGDDDQSIYAFRGATIKNILEFEKDFPNAKVVKLEQNYRSTANILEVANAVIQKNERRKGKKLWTAGDKGELIQTYVATDETDEASFVARGIQQQIGKGFKYGDIAVFYRTNAQSRALEEALAVRGIPYRIYGGLKFYDRKEIKDMLAYLRLLLNESDSQSFLRVVNTPIRGVGAATVQAIVDEAKTKGLTLLQAARSPSQRNKGVMQFLDLYDELKARLVDTMPSDLIVLLLEKSGYRERLIATNDPTVESRLENLQELRAIAQVMEFDAQSPAEALRVLLDRVALTAGSDIPAEHALEGVKKETAQKDVVSLMTLHLAKGLEFPVVYLTGLEEGLLPHYRSADDRVAVEEERRLCYVGITRAMKLLHVSRASIRGLFAAGGSSGYREVSRFAYEMPPHCLQHHNGEFIRSLGFSVQRDDLELDEEEKGWNRNSKERGRSHWQQDQTKASSGKQLLNKKLALQSLRPADSFASRPPVKKPLRKEPAPPPQPAGPLAAVHQLIPGVRVEHATFGKGAITSTEPDPSNDPEKFKVIVKFDNSEEPKKFIYKFAKLALES